MKRGERRLHEEEPSAVWGRRLRAQRAVAVPPGATAATAESLNAPGGVGPGHGEVTWRAG